MVRGNLSKEEAMGGDCVMMEDLVKRRNRAGADCLGRGWKAYHVHGLDQGEQYPDYARSVTYALG